MASSSARHQIVPAPAPFGLSGKVAKMIEQLKEDPSARERFEERLRFLRAQKRKHYRGKNFDTINQEKLQEHIPECQEKRRREIASQRAKMRSSVTKRREEIEEAQDQYMLEWTQRNEKRRQQREEEEARRKLEEERLLRKHRWLVSLSIIRFVHFLGAEVQSDRLRMAQERAEISACQTIQRWILRRLTFWRRKVSHNNAIKFRMGLLAYCRHARVQVAQMAHPRVAHCLSMRSQERESPTIQAVIHNFLGQVRRVQRAYRRIRTMQKARVEALSAHFVAERLVPQFLQQHITVQFVPQPAAPQATSIPEYSASKPRSGSLKGRRQTHVEPHRKGTMLSGDAGHRAASEKHSEGQRKPKGSSLGLPALSHPPRGASSASPVPGRRNTHHHLAPPPVRAGGLPPQQRRNRDSGPVDVPRSDGATNNHPKYVLDYKGNELLPDWVRLHVLRKHVRDMQRGYWQRFRDWKKQKDAMQIDAEIEKMGLGGRNRRLEQILRKRPRAIDIRALPQLYAETYEAWVGREFRSMAHRRAYLMVRVWNSWHKFACHGEVGPHAEDEHVLNDQDIARLQTLKPNFVEKANPVAVKDARRRSTSLLAPIHAAFRSASKGPSGKRSSSKRSPSRRRPEDPQQRQGSKPRSSNARYIPFM